jgi:excisionase family DNA binding protein
MMEQLLSVEEAARRLGGLSKWTIHAWLAQGKLRRTKVGARTMIRESELEKVIRDGGKSLSGLQESGKNNANASVPQGGELKGLVKQRRREPC